MHQKLQAALPDKEIVDIGLPSMKQRLLKTPEEIELIRNGAQVADIGGAACVAALGAGVPEFVIARHSTHTMVQEIAKRYPDSDLMDTWTWFQSGLNTDGAHNPLTTRSVQKGDILQSQLLPDDRGLLHRLRTYPLPRPCIRRTSAALGGELSGASPRVGVDPSRVALL
jgi:creatinase